MVVPCYKENIITDVINYISKYESLNKQRRKFPKLNRRFDSELQI